jgi:hypothetical protein
VLGVISIFFDATIKQFVSGVSGDGFLTQWQPQVTQCVRTVLLLLLLMFHLVFCCCFSCYTGDDSHQDCVVQEVHDHGWLSHNNSTLATFIGTLASRLKAYHHCRTDSDLVQLRSVALSLARDQHRAIGHRAGMMVLRQDRFYTRCKA